MILCVLSMGISTPRAQTDRFAEYATIAQHVPHERIKTRPMGDKLAIDLLVKPGITDKQIVELVGWYRSVGASMISLYDDRTKANEGVCAIAMYFHLPTSTRTDEDLVRYKYKGDELVGITPIKSP